jgi:hypothetical protein
MKSQSPGLRLFGRFDLCKDNQSGKTEMNKTALLETLKLMEEKKTAGMWRFNPQTGKENEPIEQRELTQQEASQWCGVAPATVSKWAENGLKFVAKGKRRLYRVNDIEDFIREKVASC